MIRDFTEKELNMVSFAENGWRKAVHHSNVTLEPTVAAGQPPQSATNPSDLDSFPDISGM